MQQNGQSIFDKTHPIKYAAYSLVLPGLGQYALAKETSNISLIKRTLSFISVELLAFVTTNLFNKKYEDQKYSYKGYADTEWDFGKWILDYHQFENTDFSELWENPDGMYLGIGEGGHHHVLFYYGEEQTPVRTTEDNFINNLKAEIFDAMDNQEDIYSGEHSIRVHKDQHFYENIGKYNEFFSGWSDANEDNITVYQSNHGYRTPRSPIKNNYLASYDKAEEFSDYAEYAIWGIYFNHFVSMIDAFILAHKFNGDVMLSSSTVFNKKTSNEPIGIELYLHFNL